MTMDEADAIAAELVSAGLLTIRSDEEGRETWTLTPKGAQVGRLVAVNVEDGEVVLDALLGAGLGRLRSHDEQEGSAASEKGWLRDRDD